MKTKIPTLFFGLVLTPCVSLAAGAPDVVSSFQQQFDAIQQQLNTLTNASDSLVNTSVVCPPGAAVRFVDNSDGTLCDHQTGLMWEIKDANDNSTDYTNPHDVDNSYKWSDGSAGPPDGGAFTHFLAQLNGEVADTEPSEQLGGYSDWRLPTSAELQSIVDCTFIADNGWCIDPIFGATASNSNEFWSSTSETRFFGGNFSAAWVVHFNDGRVNLVNKNDGVNVRAVRGGP